MIKLLEIKELIKRIYNAYSVFIIPVLKFFLAFIALFVINSNVGYFYLLSNVVVEMTISLACMFLPISGIAVVISLVIVGDLYGLSVFACLAVLIVFVVMYLLFFRFSPKHGILLIAIPVLFFMNIPYIVPILAGLMTSPIAILPAILGLYTYFMLSNIGMNAQELKAIGTDDPVALIKDVLLNGLKDEAFIVSAIAFVAVIIVVYVVRRLAIDYSHYIAIGVGTVLMVVIMLVGSLKFQLEPHATAASVIIGGIISCLIALIVDFFVLTVDYSRTEFVQFEDDDYYYYVKAVPKIKVTAPQVMVRRINAQKAKKDKQA